jgi:hypothetical protein
MERDKERGDATSRNEQRGWTRRLTGPVQYRRYTGDYYDGQPRIFFAFDLLPGQAQLPAAIYEVMKNHELHRDGFPSGLKSKKNGTLWYLPDDEHGRGMADHLDMVLQDLASKLARDSCRKR